MQHTKIALSIAGAYRNANARKPRNFMLNSRKAYVQKRSWSAAVQKPPRRQANQIAIARAAGVSVSTVSRALSNAPGISQERREQIRKLAQDTGYFTRPAAPASSRVLLTYVTSSMAMGGLAPFYDAVVAGLSAAAGDAGLGLAVKLVEDSNFDLARVLRDHADVRPIATLLVGIDARAEILEHFAGDGGPLVLVNGYDPALRFDCVAPNNFFGAALATGRLIEAGHRSLLYLEDHIRWTTVQRRRGFLSAVAETSGVSGSVLAITGDREARLAAGIARRRRGETDWTAVFAVNDMMAIRLMGALESAGFRVPDDISVVGFDDLLYASMMSPPLSTMSVDCRLIGQQAIALLLRRLAEPRAVPLQVDCAVGAKAGSTIAPPAQK